MVAKLTYCIIKAKRKAVQQGLAGDEGRTGWPVTQCGTIKELVGIIDAKLCGSKHCHTDCDWLSFGLFFESVLSPLWPEHSAM